MIDNYNEFDIEKATKWGRLHYMSWMPNLQVDDTNPKTSVENFFCSYMQGIHHVYNRYLRFDTCFAK